MENNRVFYVKYNTNQPVGLNTHVLIHSTGLWAQRLFSISDLVAAFFPNTPPNELGQYTIHLPLSVDGSYSDGSVGPFIRPGTQLVDLISQRTFLNSDEHPLLIQITDSQDVKIIPDNFLHYRPPEIMFSDTKKKSTLTKTSGPRAHPKEPANVVPWTDFLSNAESYHFESSSALISPPTFVNFATKVSDETTLHSRIDVNILNPINLLLFSLGYNLAFTGHSEILTPVLKGWPDHVLHENHELKSFIETKTIWDLPTPKINESIIQWWDEDFSSESSATRKKSRPSVFHVIGQVYGYLSNHQLRYGILTNGQVFWYLYRPNLPDSPSTLLIAPPISLVSESPTLFQSLFYFISLVIDGHKSGKTPDNSPVGVPFPLIPQSFSGRDIKNVPADLDLSQLNEKIGDGFCGNVFKYTMLDGKEIAVKCCDKINNRDGYKMMMNEVKIYRKLEDLQGTVVPTLRFSGYSGEMFLIGTDYIKGKHLEGDEKTKENVTNNLKRKLAQYKIEHGDLRDDNILQDESGNYWVLDFGKSKTCH